MKILKYLLAAVLGFLFATFILALRLGAVLLAAYVLFRFYQALVGGPL